MFKIHCQTYPLASSAHPDQLSPASLTLSNLGFPPDRLVPNLAYPGNSQWKSYNIQPSSHLQLHLCVNINHTETKPISRVCCSAFFREIFWEILKRKHQCVFCKRHYSGTIWLIENKSRTISMQQTDNDFKHLGIKRTACLLRGCGENCISLNDTTVKIKLQKH